MGHQRSLPTWKGNRRLCKASPSPVQLLSPLSSRLLGSIQSFLFPTLPPALGSGRTPSALRAQQAAAPSRDSGVTRPLHPRPSRPLTSDPVSADPQLDINSRSPESQPGAPSGPRAGAQSPAQQVWGKSSKSWGSESVGGGGQGSRRRRLEKGEGCRQLLRRRPAPPETEVRAAAAALSGEVTRLRAPRSWPGLRGPGARRAAQRWRPRSAPSRGAAPGSTRWAGLTLPPELRSGLEIRTRHHVNRRGESREDMRAPGAQAGP